MVLVGWIPSDGRLRTDDETIVLSRQPSVRRSSGYGGAIRERTREWARIEADEVRFWAVAGEEQRPWTAQG